MITRKYLEELLSEKAISRLSGISNVDYKTRFILKLLTHISPSINNSIQMLLINFLFQHIDIQVISHAKIDFGNLDLLALFSTPQQFETIFMDYISDEA